MVVDDLVVEVDEVVIEEVVVVVVVTVAMIMGSSAATTKHYLFLSFINMLKMRCGMGRYVANILSPFCAGDVLPVLCTHPQGPWWGRLL